MFEGVYNAWDCEPLINNGLLQVAICLLNLYFSDDGKSQLLSCTTTILRTISLLAGCCPADLRSEDYSFGAKTLRTTRGKKSRRSNWEVATPPSARGPLVVTLGQNECRPETSDVGRLVFVLCCLSRD